MGKATEVITSYDRQYAIRCGHSHLFKTDVQRGDSAVQFGVPELASADEIEGFWPQRIMVCPELKRRAT